MIKTNRVILLLTMLLLLLPVFLISNYGQRTVLPMEEFIKRRAALADQVKEGLIVLFANADNSPGLRFRQDNDFYYFTGIEDKNAILAILPATRQAVLFLPHQTRKEATYEGKNLLDEPNAKEKTGLTDIVGLDFFNEALARWLGNEKNQRTIYVRLSAPDTVENNRGDTLIMHARRCRNPYNDQIMLDHYRVQKLKEQYPAFTFKDITPIIDSLRVIKSPAEIEILRRNGKISAEAVKQAMRVSGPGVYEYELEAEALHVITKNGARGTAFPTIVGSGPNSCIMHYADNNRAINPNEVVLMDFGADLDYYCMDITRTWPASGKFTPEQREIYQTVLEVQKACIAAYRPGVTEEDVRKYAAETMKKKNLDPRGLKGGIHHYLDMCTHGVGPRDVPLKEGMVFTIEPALYFPEKNFGVRIEDTVLITKNGCEVLTKDAPKEIAEIETLVKEK